MVNLWNLVNDILIYLFYTYYIIPIVTVSMYSGRTQREKDRLAEAMTEDIAKI